MSWHGQVCKEGGSEGREGRLMMIAPWAACGLLQIRQCLSVTARAGGSKEESAYTS
jgi:hypothetical protein